MLSKEMKLEMTKHTNHRPPTSGGQGIRGGKGIQEKFCKAFVKLPREGKGSVGLSHN